MRVTHERENRVLAYGGQNGRQNASVRFTLWRENRVLACGGKKCKGGYLTPCVAHILYIV